MSQNEVMAVMKRSKCAVLPAFGHFTRFFCHFASVVVLWVFLFSEISKNSTVGTISLLPKVPEQSGDDLTTGSFCWNFGHHKAPKPAVVSMS